MKLSSLRAVSLSSALSLSAWAQLRIEELPLELNELVAGSGSPLTAPPLGKMFPSSTRTEKNGNVYQSIRFTIHVMSYLITT